MLKYVKKGTQSGFTLIELLVVIGIIGLLATLITINVQSARQKSRCAKRRADIVSLQAPLEAYYDANKAYPSTGTWWGTCSGYGSHDVTGSNGWIPNLAPTYIRRLPSDPNESTNRCYLYFGDSSGYKIMAFRAADDGCTVNDPKDILYDPQYPNLGWMVCSGGSACDRS